MSNHDQKNILREEFADMQVSSIDAKTNGRASMLKDNPLLNLSPESLNGAFAKNLFDLFRAIAYLPGAELEENSKISKHLAFPTNPMFKGVWQSRFSETESDLVIKETISWFKA